MEQVREMYWEAKRAPDNMAILDRNPYRREKIIKKIFGNTSEERKENKKILAKEYAEKCA